MRPVDWKLVRSVVWLVMPTVAVLLFGAWFLAHDVPRIVRDRRDQISAETEAAANNARLDPSKADFIWQRGKGIVKGDAARFGDMFPADMTWKAWRPMRRFNQKDNMLGWRETPAGRLVWARGRTPDDDTLVYARLTGIDVRDYAFTLYAAVCLFLAVLVGMTFASVRFFVEYIHSRDDFMVAAAHDMTTPLVGMRYMIGRDDATAKKLNERMIRLVANIKDFMRLGGRRAQPERKPFDIVAAYEEAYSLFRDDYRDVLDGRDAGFDASALAAPDGSRTLAMGDETLTIQILWNLLGNDLKYAAPYGHVQTTMSVADGFVTVDIADEGKGMSPREMSKAFNRYYRAKTVLETGKGGFGIGLPTAREFAEAMGGSLTVRANSPKGCVFTFRIPCAQRES